MIYSLALSAVQINWIVSKHCPDLALSEQVKGFGLSSLSFLGPNPQLSVLSLRLIKYFQPHLDEVNL